MGWRPRSLRSKIASRVLARRHPAKEVTPQLSGPRWRMAAAILRAAGSSVSTEVSPTMPAIPHISFTLLQHRQRPCAAWTVEATGALLGASGPNEEGGRG